MFPLLLLFSAQVFGHFSALVLLRLPSYSALIYVLASALVFVTLLFPPLSLLFFALVSDLISSFRSCCRPFSLLPLLFLVSAVVSALFFFALVPSFPLVIMLLFLLLSLISVFCFRSCSAVVPSFRPCFRSAGSFRIPYCRGCLLSESPVYWAEICFIGIIS